MEQNTRLLGISKAMNDVRQLVNKVAVKEANVLILGETGTGKEMVARSIHENSNRKDGPFVPINCGAVPAELFESELFGHEKGAFTGAISARKGRFELAEGGTLFLDEIGDMPLDMQVKILRVLQEKMFERVGGTKQIPSNVRIIAATHQNLEQMVEENQFRMDLFYRLNVFPIQTPSLKERPEDIPVLIDSIVDGFTEGGEPIRFDERAIQQLQRHHWEGNVRELLNLIERLSILYPGEEISVDKLPLRFVEDELAECSSEVRVSELELLHDETVDLKTKIKNYEINFILKALEITSGNVSQAANKLSLQRTTLVEKSVNTISATPELNLNGVPVFPLCGNCPGEMVKLYARTHRGLRGHLGSKHQTEIAPTMPHLLTHWRCELALCIAMICLALTAYAAENEIVGSEGSDRLVGTPEPDYFVGGAGADVFVINYLSATPDVIADFDPEEGDIIELAFNSANRGMTFRRENFSINRRGVVKYRIGNTDQDLVRLNRSDLRLELDPRKGRYFLKFSREF